MNYSIIPKPFQMPTAGIHNRLPFSTEFGDRKNNTPALFIISRAGGMKRGPYSWTILSGKVFKPQ
jgi:hypothetical protein